jgi:hypothetical protein
MRVTSEEALLQVKKWLTENTPLAFVLTGRFCQAWLVGTVSFASEFEIHLAVRGNEQPECLVVVPMREVNFDYCDDREPARFFVLPKQAKFSSYLEISSLNGDRFILGELKQ